MIKNTIINAIAEIEKRAKTIEVNEKLDELKAMLADRGLYPAKEEETKKTNPIVVALAIIGAVAAVAAIAYCVYMYLIPEDSEDFEDFDEDYYEDFEDIEVDDDDDI